MAHRVGLCTNIIYCSFASARQDIQVAADARFVCPQCGKPLSDMPATVADRRGRMAVIAGAGLALTGGALFVIGALFGHGSAPATAMERAASVPPSAAHPQTASLPAAQRPMQKMPAPAVTQAASVPSPAAPSPASAMRVAMIQPVPPPAQADKSAAAQPAVTAPAPSSDAQAGELKAAALRSVQVLEQRRAELLAKQAADAKAAQQAQADKAAQAARSAQAAREAQAERDARAKQEADDKRAARQARAVQEAKAAQEALAAQKAREAQEAAAVAAKPAAPVQVAALSPPPKPALRPAGPDRGFSATPLSGGAPTYPDAYESEGRSGQVDVSCRIDTTGHPSGCHVLGAKGGNAFGTAVLSWLGSGRVRYAPVLHAGMPVAQTQQWTMNFQP